MKLFDGLNFYVDVCLEGGSVDTSAAVRKQIESMGGKASTRWNPAITHLIWMNGKAATADKYLTARGSQHIVRTLNPLWVAESIRLNRLAEEKEFAVDIPALSLLCDALPRRKSMEPQTSKSTNQKRASLGPAFQSPLLVASSSVTSTSTAMSSCLSITPTAASQSISNHSPKRTSIPAMSRLLSPSRSRPSNERDEISSLREGSTTISLSIGSSSSVHGHSRSPDTPSFVKSPRRRVSIAPSPSTPAEQHEQAELSHNPPSLSTFPFPSPPSAFGRLVSPSLHNTPRSTVSADSAPRVSSATRRASTGGSLSTIQSVLGISALGGLKMPALKKPAAVSASDVALLDRLPVIVPASAPTTTPALSSDLKSTPSASPPSQMSDSVLLPPLSSRKRPKTVVDAHGSPEPEQPVKRTKTSEAIDLTSPRRSPRRAEFSPSRASSMHTSFELKQVLSLPCVSFKATGICFSTTGTSAEVRTALQTVTEVLTNDSPTRISEKSTDKISHLILEKPARTAKVLFALARGAWILNSQYLSACLESQCWLPESRFIADAYQTGAVRSRQAHLQPEHRGLLHGISVFVNTDILMDQYIAHSLIEAAGGQVASTARAAKVCLSASSLPVGCVVRPEWLFDSLTQYDLLPFATYQIAKK